MWSIEVVGDPAVAAENRPSADFAVADEGYFRTLDLPIVAGRGFSDARHRRRRRSASSTKRSSGGSSGAGTRSGCGLRCSGPRDETPLIKEIVGVACQPAGVPAQPEELLQVYMPLRQYPTGDVYLVAEAATGPAEALTPLIRAIVARHDPNTPVRRDRTLEFLSVESTAGYRFRAAMVGTFAGLALVLALVGVFGVLAYSVQQRRREFGVRIALGASGSSVLGLVLRGAATMIAAGTLVGLGLALVLSKTISAFLFGVQPIDPVTFVGVVLVLAVTAALAAARRPGARHASIRWWRFATTESRSSATRYSGTTNGVTFRPTARESEDVVCEHDGRRTLAGARNSGGTRRMRQGRKPKTPGSADS